jgi:hypothetical protein
LATDEDSRSKADAEQSVQRGLVTELLNLCETSYAVEMARKADIEKKAQFYLALITGLLGLLTLNDKLTGLQIHLAKAQTTNRVAITIELYALYGFIVSALFCVLRVMMPRLYEQPYPRALLTYLHRAETKFRSETDLIRARAEEFAWAAEVSSFSNIAKSRWLLRLAVCVLLVLVDLALILMTQS